MDVIDRIESYVALAGTNGISVRFEDLQGIESGLCELNGKSTLLIDRQLKSADQLEIFAACFGELPQAQSTSHRVAG